MTQRLTLAVLVSAALLSAPGGAAAQVVGSTQTPTQNASSTPQPSPTDTATLEPAPTAAPTAAPTPSDTPSPTPTDTEPPTLPPTLPPTEPPTLPPAEPPPTTPPAEDPTSTPDPTEGADFVDDTPIVTPIDEEAAAAFAAATTHLREVTAALAAAEAAVLDADARLSMSAGHAMRAKADARIAGQRADTVDADLGAATDLLDSAHLSVDGYARRTYQDGAAGAWSTVLAADDAGDLANLATDLQTVSDTRGHALGLLTELPKRIDSLEKAAAEAKLAATVARGEWKAAEASYDRLALRISTARASIEPLRKDVAAATAAATAAIPADQALSVARRQESDRLATDIVAASAALEAAGGVVPGTGTFSRPATGVITSDYGWRVHPILGYQKLHTGIDYDGADGTVYAADDGVVILTVWSSSYGNVTVVDHGRSGGRHFATLYAHQAGYLVDEGDVVRKGQAIGAVGSTGLSTGPHLHFEVRLDGVPVDPRPFL